MIRTSKPTQRQGVILIVVLSLLTLFAIVGISFVLVADSHALASKIARDAETTFKPDIDPDQSFAAFMGQMMYDVNDDQTGIYSGLRGHSFARNMFGYNDTTLPILPIQNITAYSGIGRTRIPIASAGVTLAGATGVGGFLGYLVNHTYNSADGFLLDPERISARPTAPSGTPWTQTKGAYVSGAVPYTYADHNNFYLATIDPATGAVKVPSFHRPWLFGNLNGGGPGIGNWSNTHGKYLTLRPRPSDMSPGFPYPEDAGGDVKNLIGAPGGNDSIWIDIGAPVMTSADGRKYKPLFAPLIIDLDGRVNLNVHGNIRGAGDTHASNQGWGKWEVNLNKVLAANAAEVQQLFLGTPTAGTPRIVGRYGSTDRKPNNGGVIAGTSFPQVWAPIDADSVDSARVNTTQFKLPGEPTTVGYQSYPTFPSSGYPVTPVDVMAENTAHPRRYNSLRPASDDRAFPAMSMAALLRRGQTGANGLTSELLQLLPQNLVRDTTLPVTNATNVLRDKISRLVTTHSTDLDRPGGLPYIWTPDYEWQAALGYPTKPASNTGTIPFGDIPFYRAPTPPTPPTGSDFDANSWRSTASSLLRIDLNRTLRAYPVPVAATGQIDLTNMADQTAYQGAVTDRTNLAKDLYGRLVLVTGAAPLPTAAPFALVIDPLFRTHRWLAQLAINIVDYIDEDDTMTVWQWSTTPADSVYGTEQPSLLINEVYSQTDNLPMDAGILGPTVASGMRKAADGYNINFWVELHNPRLPQRTASSPAAPAPLPTPALRDNVARLTANGTNVYQIVLASYPDLKTGRDVLANPENTTGDIKVGTVTPTVTNLKVPMPAPATPFPAEGYGAIWDTAVANKTDRVYPVSPSLPLPAMPPYTLQPPDANNQHASLSTDRNDRFYVIGPDDQYLAPGGDMTIMDRPGNPNLTTTHKHPQMRLTLPGGLPGAPAAHVPMVFLRRLACPHIGYDPVANPYITVDTFLPLQKTTTEQRALHLHNDARAYDDAGPNALSAMGPTGYRDVVDRFAVGRKQPFGSNETQVQVPTPPVPPAMAPTEPKHTFFRHNFEKAAAPVFDWMVHLDRPLVSPIEILHVSAWKPHQLTEKFVKETVTEVMPMTMPKTYTYSYTYQQHKAAWTNPDTRLHRLLEYVQTHSYSDGVFAGGRVPGRININAMLDETVFQALCDAQVGNRFAAAHVTNVYKAFMDQRDGLTSGVRDFPGMTSPDFQRPIWSMAMGTSSVADHWTNGTRSLANTLLSPVAGGGPASPRMFDPQVSATQHPYHQLELLNKIYNNVTTRSNVFAVWVTVGYFEVTNENARPVQLGAEIGRAESRHIRHRMFAIVDRTKMEAYRPATPWVFRVDASQNVTLVNTNPPPPPTPAPPAPWNLLDGTWLTLDPDTNNEMTVVVQGGKVVGSKTVTAKDYASAVIYGNPGPRARYNPRMDPPILYYGMID